MESTRHQLVVCHRCFLCSLAQQPVVRMHCTARTHWRLATYALRVRPGELAERGGHGCAPTPDTPPTTHWVAVDSAQISLALCRYGKLDVTNSYSIPSQYQIIQVAFSQENYLGLGFYAPKKSTQRIYGVYVLEAISAVGAKIEDRNQVLQYVLYDGFCYSKGFAVISRHLYSAMIGYGLLCRETLFTQRTFTLLRRIRIAPVWSHLVIEV